MRKTKSTKQRGLWDRLMHAAPAIRESKSSKTNEPRPVSITALPAFGEPLVILGDTRRYCLRDPEHDVMHCGAEFTYLLLVPYGATDPMAAKSAVPIQIVRYAE